MVVLCLFLYLLCLVNCLPLEALEVQARVTACATQSGKEIGCEQRRQAAAMSLACSLTQIASH
jgi:hypothetical protein